MSENVIFAILKEAEPGAAEEHPARNTLVI